MKQSSESWSCARALQIYCGCTEMGEDLSLTLSALILGIVMAQPDHRGGWRISWLPSLGSISIFQFLSGNALIVPILHSGDHMWDKKRRDGVIRFVVKVCSLSPCSGFNPALWFPQSWHTSFKKGGNRVFARAEMQLPGLLRALLRWREPQEGRGGAEHTHPLFPRAGWVGL